MNRRQILALSGPLAVLAACGTLPSSVGGDGASREGVPYLAQIRQSNGLAAVSPDSELEVAARRQAGYMAAAGKMEHTTGWGRDFASRMKADSIAGPAAENIARGRFGIEKAFQMWVDSPPHRRNMLDGRFTRFGLASAPGKDGRRYWALVLAK